MLFASRFTARLGGSPIDAFTDSSVDLTQNWGTLLELYAQLLVQGFVDLPLAPVEAIRLGVQDPLKVVEYLRQSQAEVMTKGSSGVWTCKDDRLRTVSIKLKDVLSASARRDIAMYEGA
jgi:hypothetical protein